MCKSNFTRRKQKICISGWFTVVGLIEFLSLIDDKGQSFYNTAIHFKMLRALICNPYIYAQKMNMANGEDAQFKSEASVKNLKELFIKEAVTVRTPVATPRTKKEPKKDTARFD